MDQKIGHRATLELPEQVKLGEKPETEILVQPENSILELGDGYLATLFSAIEVEEENGKTIIDALIEPSLLLKKRYNIPDSDLNANRQMHFKMAKIDLIPINLFDSANRKWLYTKTFKHVSTPVDKLSLDLKDQVTQLEQRVWSLEGDIAFLSEQLQLAKDNPGEYSAQSLELAEKMSSIMMKMSQKKSEVGSDAG